MGQFDVKKGKDKRLAKTKRVCIAVRVSPGKVIALLRWDKMTRICKERTTLATLFTFVQTQHHIMNKQMLFCLTLFFCLAQLSAQVPDALGVQLYSFRNEMKADLRGTLKKVKDMGFKTVETGKFAGMSAAESKKLLDEFGLKAVSMGASFDELSDPAQLEMVIQNAQTFGAEFVMCAWIPHNGNDFTIDDIKKAIKVFNTSGKALKKKGVQLLYHPHGFEFRPYRDDLLLFDYLVQKTKPKFVNFEMDIYWVKNPGQDPAAWLRKYPKRWKAMHMKDQQKGTPGNANGQTDVEWNVVVGSGNQDIPAVMQEARKNGVRYYFIEDESARSLLQVPLSIAYLKTVHPEW